MLKHYYKPTPVKYRKMGDAILASSTAATFIGIQMDEKWMIYIFLLLGVIGKFMTNFFSEENTEVAEVFVETPKPIVKKAPKKKRSK